MDARKAMLCNGRVDCCPPVLVFMTGRRPLLDWEANVHISSARACGALAGTLLTSRGDQQTPSRVLSFTWLARYQEVDVSMTTGLHSVRSVME